MLTYPKRLWFASFLLFLHCQTQYVWEMGIWLRCCDLLLFYYFCTVKHNLQSFWHNVKGVVICFFFIIFALSNTIKTLAKASPWKLWFASFLLFLHCQTQCSHPKGSWRVRCDLLLFYYFCTVKHNKGGKIYADMIVVICFFFIIFALSNTIHPDSSMQGSHVVICFFFIIFALSNTIGYNY